MRTELTDELKRALRASGITYARVARHLRLSEASVKRLFSRGGFTLERFESVCELAGIGLAQLVEGALEHRLPERQLTRAQEQQIVADPGLFLVAWLVLGRTPAEQIVSMYRLSAAELQRHLIRLDRLKVIDLLPRNRVRLRVDARFSWIPGGPVERHIRQRLLREYLAGDFSGPQAEFFFHGDALTEAALARVRRALQAAARECMVELERDRAAPGRRSGAAFLLALRPWDYSGFNALRR